MAADLEWSWLNEHRLTHALDSITDDDELDAVLDALDQLLIEPTGGNTAPMQGTRDKTDRTIALLPYGWVLVYSIYPDGVPPAFNRPALVIRSMSKFPGT